ncbi:MAG TPA: hypothetical protein VNA30_02040 [Mycobacteriales bacterium]|nr:hypothetical protein [Mycobacteriales bacterium]
MVRQSAVSQLAGCLRCGAASTVRVEMLAPTGHTLVMSSCPRCDERTWRADGQELALSEVLRLAAGDAAFTVIPAQRRQPTVRRTA